MKFIKEDKNRRQFLVGAGGSLLALPFLPSLSAQAQGNSSIKRFVSVGMRDGYIGAYFHPQNIPANAFTLLGDRTYKAPLQNGISTLLDSKFDSLKDEIMICKNVDMLTATNHFRHSFLMAQHFSGNSSEFIMPTADRRHSIDHYIADAIYPQGRDPKIMNLGVAYNYYGNNIVTGPSNSHKIDSNGNPVNNIAYGDPQAAFDVLFANTQLTQSEQIKLKNAKLSIADRVRQNLNSLIAQGKISNADKQKLQAHVAEVNDLENRLQNIQITSCSVPTRPSTPYTGSASGYFAAMRLLMDLAIMAIKCDIVRVVNLEIAPDSILVGVPQFGVGHHAISHTNDFTNWKAIDLEYFDHVHYLVSGLKTQGLLDDTLVLVGNEIGSQSGTSPGTPTNPTFDGNHAGYDMMALTFGMKNKVQAGHYFKFDVGQTRGGRWNNGQGIAYNEWLITIMAAMGVQKSQYEQGRIGYGDYRKDRWNQCNPNIISPPSRRGKVITELLKP